MDVAPMTIPTITFRPGRGSLAQGLDTQQDADASKSVSVGEGTSGWRRSWWPIKLLVSMVLVTWIVSRADLREVAGVLRDADLTLVAAALGLNLVGWTISMTRWRILLKARGVEVSLPRMLQAYLSAIFFNNLLPSTVGGDSLRAHDSWRWGAGKAGAMAVVGVDRLLGILALLVFAVIALFLVPQVIEELPLLPVWLGLGAAGILGFAAAALVPARRLRARLAPSLEWLPRPVRTPLRRFSAALRTFRDAPGVLWKAMALSVALQLTVIFHFYLIALALSLDVAFLGFFLIIPIALALMAIPVSVNAIGIRENVFAFFLGLFGVSLGDALAFAWLAFALVLVQGVVGGVVYAFRRRP